MNEAELRALLKALQKRSQAIIDKAKAENRDLSEDETASIEQNTNEFNASKAELEALVAAREANEKRMADIAAQASFLETSQGRAAQGANTPTGQAAADAKAVTSGQRELVDDDPKHGFKSPRAFVTDVMVAGTTGRVSEKLKPLTVKATAGSDEQGGYSDPYGGYMVPEAFSPNLLKTSAPDDPMGSRTRKIPMSAPRVSMPARVDKDHSSSVSGGFVVYRRAEADTVSATRAELEKVSLVADSLMGVAYATNEILTDSPVSFAAIIASGFADEFTSRLAYERISGTGVGEYEGLDNSGSVLSITKETNQKANTIVVQNVLKMRARCWGYGKAIWMANQTCLPQLSQLTISNGTSVVPIYHFSMVEDQPDMLLGRPIIYTEYCAALSSAGDLRLVNWNEYLEGNYQRVEGVSSIHVRFTQNESAFRFTARNAGGCWWRSALTPKNGDTLSPNIKLGAR